MKKEIKSIAREKRKKKNIGNERKSLEKERKRMKKEKKRKIV